MASCQRSGLVGEGGHHIELFESERVCAASAECDKDTGDGFGGPQWATCSAGRLRCPANIDIKQYVTERGTTTLLDPNSDVAPGAMVLLSDGETTVGRLTSEGAQDAADAGIPVYTIAFGTDSGTIVDPVSGQTVHVPVRPADLEMVAETTGGEVVRGPDRRRTRRRLLLDPELARRDARRGDPDRQGTDVALGARRVPPALGRLALSLWWLRGMVSRYSGSDPRRQSSRSRSSRSS